MNDWQRLQLARLKEIARQVWWICEIHYPHQCYHNDEADFLISGDGMGLFYGKMQENGDLLVLEIPDRKWGLIFEQHGVWKDATVSLEKLADALELCKEQAKTSHEKRTRTHS